MKLKIFFASVLIFISVVAFGQNSTRGSLLTVDTSNFSNSAGFTRPTIKMMAVNRLDNSVVYWDLSSWSQVSTGGIGSGWLLTGNVGTTAGVNFIGTTDAKDFVIKTDGLQIARFGSDANRTVKFGNNTTATGVYSTAMGTSTIASGPASTATGNSTLASGNIATAMGESALASGGFSMAVNHSTIASGDVSFAANDGAVASGAISSSFGYNTKSKGFGGFVIGTFNDSTNATDDIAYNGLNRAFQVGNGTANNSRSNAITILFNGNTGIGTTSPTSTLKITGSLGLSYVKVTSNNYNILSTDYTLSVDNAGNSWTILLPDPSTCTGRIYIIKRFDNTSSGTITVDSNGGNVQNGNTGVFGATSTLEAIGSIHANAMYQSNGTNWECINN